MYKARKYLNKNNLKNLYHDYIYPYFTYCVEVWGCASKCHLNSLFLLQKKILRIMTFSQYLSHTDSLFKNLEILPIDKIFIDRIGITICSKSLMNLSQNLYTSSFLETKTSTRMIPKVRIC